MCSNVHAYGGQGQDGTVLGGIALSLSLWPVISVGKLYTMPNIEHQPRSVCARAAGSQARLLGLSHSRLSLPKPYRCWKSQQARKYVAFEMAV